MVKSLPAMQETRVRSLGWGRFPGEGKGYPLQYSGLENSMDYTVHGVTKELDPNERLSLTHSLTQVLGKAEFSEAINCG